METVGFGSGIYCNSPVALVPGPDRFRKITLVSWAVFSADYAACTVTAQPARPTGRDRAWGATSGTAFSRLPVGPHIRTLPAASLAGESLLQIGQPNVIRPSIAANRRPVRAVTIGAVQQETAPAGGAHFGKGDFLGAFHTP